MHSNGAYTGDPNAWMFRLTDKDGKWAPFLSRAKGNGYEYYGHASHAVSFGNGHDIHVNLDSQAGNYVNLNGGYSFNLPPGETAQVLFTGAHKFVCTDLLVFRVKEKGIPRENFAHEDSSPLPTHGRSFWDQQCDEDQDSSLSSNVFKRAFGYIYEYFSVRR